jgi:hypothetical protein
MTDGEGDLSEVLAVSEACAVFGCVREGEA